MPDQSSGAILAVDYGDVRVGLALASPIALMANPFATLLNDNQLLGKIEEIIKSENVAQLVVGYPRNLEGEETDQTNKIRVFIKSLQTSLNIPIDTQDEALTSVKAEEELNSRNRPYSREDIDSLAAAFILEDWLKHHGKI